MRFRWITPLVAATVAASHLCAQAPVTMPAGSYIIQARDSARADSVGMAGWPLVLKGNGAFTITSPDTLTFSGKLMQKDGIATYTDQACSEPGQYIVRQERGGYAFDVKSETCSAGWSKLLFVPGKPKH
ncbi:MAG TPA: hypothetical protein VGM20_06665 [Gemmatimonadales bacterium]|jgi:hypothetical protein